LFQDDQHAAPAFATPLFAGVLVLYFFSILFVCLHIYLVALLNGAKLAMTTEAEEDEKRAAALQVSTLAVVWKERFVL
jgi:hypothetical protein